MHRGSAAAAKDTAGAAKAQAIVFKVDHDNYYLNAQALQSVEYMRLEERDTERRSRQRPGWNMVVCAHLVHMGCVNLLCAFS